MTRPRSQDPVHYLRLVLLAAAVIGLGYMLFVAVGNYAVLTRRPCLNQAEPLGVPWWGYFVFGSLGTFCLGALIGYWRHASGLGADVPVQRDWSAVAVQVVLTVFFMLGVMLLVYANVGRVGSPGPLADYLLRALRQSPPEPSPPRRPRAPSPFLLGQWLWRPWEAADA